MTKRLLALLLAVIMCFVFVGCQDDTQTKDKTNETTATQGVSDSNREGTSTPVLYKANADDGNVVWLFGSIHVGRDDYYPLPDYVMDAYEQSDALAVEFDLNAFEKDISAQTEMLTSMVYTDGTTIGDNIDKEIYDEAVRILEENEVYNSLYDYYMPCMWSSLVDNCLYTKLSIDTENGIDKHLLNLAKKDKKEILEVESAQLQYAMLSGFSPQLQELLLEQSIESYNESDEYKEELNKMQDTWVSGNEKEFSKLISIENELDLHEDEMTEEELELFEEYYNAMIVERNEAMTQYAIDALKSGKEVFICVGAAHIIGEGAIAQNLKELGYKVERVQ